jgi:hypothetical protein
MRSILAALAGMVALTPGAAWGQEDKTSAAICDRTDLALPAELIGWTHRPALPGAAKIAGAKASKLAIGKGVDAILPVTGKVAYVAQLKKPGDPKHHGGLFEFTVDKEGAYAVALGGAARVDVMRDKTALTSTAHSDGPSCSTIRKTVDFKLTPGVYVLQISASADPKLALMVTRRP